MAINNLSIAIPNQMPQGFEIRVGDEIGIFFNPAHNATTRINTCTITISKMDLPPPTQIVVFTPWQMWDYQ